jgi:decaprenyl-phosphate phosphoribosyltransferase
MIGIIKPYVQVLRVKQWVKNLFILIAPFFGGNLFLEENIFLLIGGLVSFSLAASCIYIINDIKDLEVDLHHSYKKTRPIASGEIGIPTALFLIFLLGSLALLISYHLNIQFFLVILTYITMNVAYSFGLKNIPILDITLIAIGFNLRVLSGGYLTNTSISHWLVIIVFLLSLFLALAKRLDDIVRLESLDGNTTRKAIQGYNTNFIVAGMGMLAGILIVSYIMYTISEEVINRLNTENLYFTAIFVVAGVLRYLQLTLVEFKSASPTKVLYTDPFILTTIFIWVLSYFFIIYLGVWFG